MTAVMNLALLSTLEVSLFSLRGYLVLCTRKLNLVKKKESHHKGEDLNPLFYIIDGLFEN